MYCTLDMMDEDDMEAMKLVIIVVVHLKEVL